MEAPENAAPLSEGDPHQGAIREADRRHKEPVRATACPGAGQLVDRIRRTVLLPKASIPTLTAQRPPDGNSPMTDPAAQITPDFQRGWDAAILAARDWHESQAKQSLIQAKRSRFPRNLEREAEVHQRSAEIIATLKPDDA